MSVKVPAIFTFSRFLNRDIDYSGRIANSLTVYPASYFLSLTEFFSDNTNALKFTSSSNSLYNLELTSNLLMALASAADSSITFGLTFSDTEFILSFKGYTESENLENALNEFSTISQKGNQIIALDLLNYLPETDVTLITSIKYRLNDSYSIDNDSTLSFSKPIDSAVLSFSDPQSTKILYQNYFDPKTRYAKFAYKTNSSDTNNIDATFNSIYLIYRIKKEYKSKLISILQHELYNQKKLLDQPLLGEDLEILRQENTHLFQNRTSPPRPSILRDKNLADTYLDVTTTNNYTLKVTKGSCFIAGDYVTILSDTTISITNSNSYFYSNPMNSNTFLVTLIPIYGLDSTVISTDTTRFFGQDFLRNGNKYALTLIDATTWFQNFTEIDTSSAPIFNLSLPLALVECSGSSLGTRTISSVSKHYIYYTTQSLSGGVSIYEKIHPWSREFSLFPSVFTALTSLSVTETVLDLNYINCRS